MQSSCSYRPNTTSIRTYKSGENRESVRQFSVQTAQADSLRSCHLNSKSRIFTASFVSGGFGFFVREFEFFGLIGPVVQIILSRTVATDA